MSRDYVPATLAELYDLRIRRERKKVRLQNTLAALTYAAMLLMALYLFCRSPL